MEDNEKALSAEVYQVSMISIILKKEFQYTYVHTEYNT